MKMLQTLALLAAATAGLTAAQAQAPEPGSVRILGITHSGPGCGPGTVATNLSFDQQAFTVLFSDFYVSAERGRQNETKDCSVRVDIDYPQGWTFGLYSVDTRGYVSLADRFATASLKTQYKFQHGAAFSVENRTLRGPLDLDYAYRAQVDRNRASFAPCTGRPRDNGLVLTTTISAHVSAQSGGALMTTDTQDGELKQRFGIVWKRCGR